MQVVQRHFLRNITDVIPEKLSVEEIESLTHEEGVDEARKKEVKAEIGELERLLAALKGIR